MNPKADHIIAIDSGQTAIKVRCGDERVSFPGIRTNTELMPQLADVVASVVGGDSGSRSARQSAYTVAIGTTGLTAAEDDPGILLGLCREMGVTRVLLAHDSVTSFLGCVGFRRGVVVASGTGVVTLGVGAERVARVDGWGNLMGDVGSGFWIGRAGLEAVMRAYDGRGPATAITELATARWPDLSQAYIELQTDPGHVGLIASFAAGVAGLAATDEVAARICHTAGVELALSASTALRLVGEDTTEAPLVCLVGGVLRSSHIKDACVARLREQWSAFEPFETQGDGLDGAHALASLPADNPLSGLVKVASAQD